MTGGSHPHPASDETEPFFKQTVECQEKQVTVSLFALACDRYFVVNAVSDNANKGTAEVTTPPGAADGLYKPSTLPIIIKATPHPGYAFKQWKLNRDNFEDDERLVKLDNDMTAQTTLVLGVDQPYAVNDPKKVTVTAEFEAITYNVALSCDPADGSGGTASVAVDGTAAKTATVGQSIAVTTTPAPNYTLASLTYTEEGSTEATDITESKSFTMPANNVSIQAKFVPITHTITFDKNAPNATGTMAAQTVSEGVATALTANAFKRSGYTFKGWNTAADGTGTAFGDKAEVTATADMTLYAQWAQNSQSKSSTSKSATSTGSSGTKSSGTQSSSGSSQSTSTKASTLARTADPTSVAGVVAAFASGILAVASGLATKRR